MTSAEDPFELDDTFATFKEMKALEEEEEYALFCLAKDRKSPENY